MPRPDASADATGAGFDVHFGVGLDGIHAGERNLEAHGLARSGSRAGSVVGRSTLDPRLSLDLLSPSLATAAGTYGTASLDSWIAFSSEPITRLPPPDQTVPLPGTLVLAGAALLAWGLSRRPATGA